MLTLRRATALVLAVSGGLAACGQPALPDPRAAALRFGDAAERGDPEAIHAMLTEGSRRAFGPDGTRRRVHEARSELAGLGRSVKESRTSIEARAEVRYVDGERATLVLEQGAFRIVGADGLPAQAHTPEQALADLRGALARRSYAALLRVLSRSAASALDRDLQSLVEGLAEPEALDVRVEGDRAEVLVPGGHKVRLRREAGAWRVDDFE